MIKQQRIEDIDDDDPSSPVDKNGILKDGRSLRVPLSMKDGWQRDMAQHFRRTDDALARHRPGFRYNNNARLNDEITRAYAEVDVRDQNAWRHPQEAATNNKSVHAHARPTMDQIYAEYDREAAEAWRRPR
jgi:hypothetical protein